METAEAMDFVVMLYQVLLKRQPNDRELEGWTAAASRMPAVQILRFFSESSEFKKRQGVQTFFPPGHFHSPIVNPNELDEYFSRSVKTEHNKIPGINLDLSAMKSFWDSNCDLFRQAIFPTDKSEAGRFYYNGSPFPFGDAITLFAMLGSIRPKKIIEIGSGFSTACMLDSAERLDLHELHFVCVEPFPERLKRLLRPGDNQRITIIETCLQRVPLSQVIDLSKDDFLFIDSTHVLKTGSDVHYELFEILPALPSGVMIHVHDCPYPFEYPRDWIFRDNYSWNEAYALRAFLMYNVRFEIVFWGSLFKQKFPRNVEEVNPQFAMNPGTSIWLKVK
jgi:hypothetical protein